MLALPSVSLAQAVLSDDANTNTSPKSTDTNYGTNPNLFVSSAGNTYIRFKFSPTLPAATSGSAVEKATIKLYLGNVTTAGKLDVYTVSGAWDESTITANNAPPLGALSSTTEQIGTDRRGKYLVVDVTDLVKQWLGDDGQGANGIPNRGLALVAHPIDGTTPEVANITFDSKENGQTSHEPQLDVQLKRGTGTVTAVTAESPLSVANSTTAPDISLGVVPVSNGGTGMITSGPTGNFLRSSGGAWASAPLTTADIPAGSGSYIQNTTGQQATSNFNISGDGTVGGTVSGNVVNSATQFNLGGSRVLSQPGSGNLFVGGEAGQANSGGFTNTFVGQFAGRVNTTGPFNTFVGNFAGGSNSTGCCNNFFGNSAGQDNTTGIGNSFFGGSAGLHNMTGESNAFFGDRSGQNNTIGSFNSFYGIFSGQNNTTGGSNTLVGALADVGFGNLNFATAIGSGAVVNTSNTVVLGRNLDTVQVPGTLNVAGSVRVGSPGQGMVLRSPDGATCRLLAIDNSGNMTLNAVACP